MDVTVKTVVAVVDDDPRVRESLESLIESRRVHRTGVRSRGGFPARRPSSRDKLPDHQTSVCRRWMELNYNVASGWHGPNCRSSSLPRHHDDDLEREL